MQPDPALAEHFAQVGVDPLRAAFPARRPLMPWTDQAPVKPGDIPALWETLTGSVRVGDSTKRPRVVYVHIPFCANHCLFCGFYRHRAEPETLRAYVDALIEEIGSDAARPGVRAVPISALYLGGGTPSAVAADDLGRLLTALRTHLPLAEDCEITVEGRVAGFTTDKIDACIAAGANRFSIGIQTFDTGLRRRLGRRASGAEARAFLTALSARPAAVVIDLIFGLPGQNDDAWCADLDVASALALDGIDLYALHQVPHAPLAAAVERGKLSPPATIGEQAGRYAEGMARLTARDWWPLSNSHLARTRRERNRYNLLVKQGADCLAFGAGAGGSFGPFSFSLHADLDAWHAASARGEKPIASLRLAAPGQPLRHRLSGTIEIGRLDLPAITAGLDPALAERLATLCAQWQRAGLLVPDGKALALTTAGRFWSPNLLRALHQVCR
jgi:anaerobilin synthase